MDSRFEQFDILRGSLFIPMFIYHLFSFYDLTNYFGSSYTSNPIIKCLGYVRTIYIILAGYSVYLSYKSSKNKEQFYTNRLKRSFGIVIPALVITFLSHYLYPSFGIKFGILHFIALGTLLISPIAHMNSSLITFICLIITHFWKIPSINHIIDTITGAQVHYSAADWFPLNKNLKFILFGLFLAQIKHKYLKPYKTSNSIINTFKFMGKHSLELYYSHFIVIMIIYYILKNKIN